MLVVVVVSQTVHGNSVDTDLNEGEANNGTDQAANGLVMLVLITILLPGSVVLVAIKNMKGCL